MVKVEQDDYYGVSVTKQGDSEGSKTGEGFFGVAPILDCRDTLVTEELCSVVRGGSVGALNQGVPDTSGSTSDVGVSVGEG